MDSKPGIRSKEWINPYGSASPLDRCKILSEDAEDKDGMDLRLSVRSHSLHFGEAAHTPAQTKDMAFNFLFVLERE
jgi:hypothetical protein